MNRYLFPFALAMLFWYPVTAYAIEEYGFIKSINVKKRTIVFVKRVLKPGESVNDIVADTRSEGWELAIGPGTRIEEPDVAGKRRTIKLQDLKPGDRVVIAFDGPHINCVLRVIQGRKPQNQGEKKR